MQVSVDMKKIEINILPLVLSILMVLISIGIMVSSQYAFSTKHYIGIACLAISTIIYFVNRKFYILFFTLTLTMGLLGLLDFYITSYKIGFAGVGINPIFLGLIILLLVLSKERTGNLNSKESKNVEEELNEILIRSFTKDFFNKTDFELKEIAKKDSKYTNEARFAANKLLEERTEL